ncbi:unnamed protein product [Amoebophrya sp. A120]|nr:unnamed protein product [Amoebophrya sp. A120]|eukprot:GSA120T00004128001.1
MVEKVLHALLFPRPHPTYEPDSDNVIWIPDVTRRKDEKNFRIPTLFLKSNNAFARYCMLFFHGNAEDLGTSRDFCKNLRTCFQCHVLAPEMPGYGLANRAIAPSEKAMIDYANSCLDFALHELQWPLDSILVVGRSIGCVSALALAASFPNLGGVALISPF